MNFSLLTQTTYPNSPVCVFVPTDHYACSPTGFALGTHAMFGCIGIVVHNPANHTGCLGHLSPGSVDSSIKVGNYFERCFELLGVTDGAGLQFVFIGNASSTNFQTHFATVRAGLGIALNNCHDARSTGGQRAVIGAAVNHGFKFVGAAAYDPANDTVWLNGGIPTPNYDAEKSTLADGGNGLQQVHSSKLSGGGKTSYCILF